MRIQVMQSVIRQVFRFSGRFTCFMLIIASVFHFGQSFSPDSASAYPHGRTSAKNDETRNRTVSEENNHSGSAIVTGQEHIYIAEGISFYGLDERSVNKIAKRKVSVSSPQKSIAKREPVRKKTTRDKPAANAQSITSLPEGNYVRNISLSGQAACTAPGSHHQNFIFLQDAKDISTKYNNEYIFQNYHYLFSALSENNRSDGGIRPPPFLG